MIPRWLEDRRLNEHRAWERSKSVPISDVRVSSLRTSREMDNYTLSNLTRDVAFNRHSMNDGHHVSPSDNGMIQIGTDGIEVKLVQGIDEEAFKQTLSAATRATIGLDLSKPLPGGWEECDQFQSYLEAGGTQEGAHWNVTCGHEEHRVTQSMQLKSAYMGKISGADWEEMMKGGLQTALETQVVVFGVSGVSRTCTHQLVRSRRASFHQQSQRASYMGDQPEVRMPESVWRSSRARIAYLRALEAAQLAYRVACEEDISYQDARFILPEATTNFIMLEYPVREFLNVYAYRACSMFQWEIAHVMRMCRSVLVKAHPWLDPYIKISCEKTGPAVVNRSDGGTETVPHHCTFQGWENVEGQCDFTWAKQDARTFRPEYHTIERKTK